QFVAGIREVDGLPPVALRVCQLTTAVHHRDADRSATGPIERCRSRGRFVEGRQPRRLQVDGINEHETRELIDDTGGEKLGNPLPGLRTVPSIDVRAGLLWMGLEVGELEAGAVERGQAVEEGLLPRDVRLAPERVGDLQRDVDGAGPGRIRASPGPGAECL